MKKILDVGCGTGSLLNYFAKRDRIKKSKKLILLIKAYKHNLKEKK